MSERSAATPDFSPVISLLCAQYQGNPKEIAASLYDVGMYLVKVPQPTDTAAALRDVVAVVNDLAAAFDSMPPLTCQE